VDVGVMPRAQTRYLVLSFLSDEIISIFVFYFFNPFF
jgi:hypothetical protein